MPVTTSWRGITTDPETARYLTAVAAEVTRMAKTVGVPDFTVTPIRGCGSYQTSTEASAGTHAGGGAVDINAEGLTDKQARVLESAARKWGGTAWFRPRVSPSGFVYGWQRHVHILRTDCTDLAYPSATRQVKDYRAGLNGLANRGPDTGNRSWVNVTWGAVKGIADTITGIGGAVVGAIPTPTAPKEDDMPTPQDLWSYTITGPDGKFKASASAWLTYANAKAENAQRTAAAASGKLDGLTALVKQVLASTGKIDDAQVQRIIDATSVAAEKGASEALATLDAQVTLKPGA